MSLPCFQALQPRSVCVGVTRLRVHRVQGLRFLRLRVKLKG